MTVTDSILDTTKLQLGLDLDDDSFDVEIIMHINTVFTVLQQLGVGPKNGFSILNKDAVWATFIDGELIDSVRTYMGLKVRLIFDPPQTGPLTSAMDEIVKQLEWRLNIRMEEVKWNATQTTSLQDTVLF